MNTISGSTCFFCSTPIDNKKTREHIISDSLLGKLGIKEEKIDGAGSFQYSRVKVPAHSECNNEFGSEYENRVINLLDDTEKLYDDLKSEENDLKVQYGPDESTTMIISTWLSKVYYGLFYNDFLKIDDEVSKEEARSVIDTDNFKMVRNAYKDGVGFCLPSSLYVFRSKDDFFDLRTFIQPQTILMKVQSLTMILCIEDGFLTKSYLNGERLEHFRKYLQTEESNNNNFFPHLLALSEIIALRTCIPKSPSFLYSNKEIVNMSLSTLVKNPTGYYEVDAKQVAEKRNEIFDSLVRQN